MSLATFKRIVKWIVGISTAWTVGNVVSNNVNPEKPHQKVEAAVAGAVVGGMVADQAEGWIGNQIDDLAETWRKITKKEDPQS